MFHYPFFNPLFSCSRGKAPPPTIILKREEYLLSRRNPAHFSQYQPFLPNFGITKTSGYDPPWQYEQKRLSGAAEHHYPTMSIETLCALPIAELAAEDSALFLWATFPQLPEALRLLKAWGFQYKTTAFVWLKLNKKARTWFYGLGFWTRGNAEICLLATRGHPKRQSAGIHQFIISPVRQHSRKPDEARDKIVALMGDVPRVELFARQETPGWDVWGNEVESSITL